MKEKLKRQQKKSVKLSFFFLNKSNKQNFHLTYQEKKREGSNKIRNNIGEILTDTTEIQKIIIRTNWTT